MGDTGDALSVDEFVEYCRTQAGLLAGKAETLQSELTDLLDEIEADIDDAQERLDERPADVEGTVSPESTDGPGASAVEDVAELEDDLRERQAVVEAKQARMAAFRDLAVAYGDLADDLQETADGRAALERVVEFEAERDAPAYFPDRQTLLEAAAGDDSEGSGQGDGSDGSDGGT